MNAIATLSLLFYPPERFLLQTSAFSLKSTSSMNLSTSLEISLLSVIPLNDANSSRCSRTVRVSKRMSCYGHTPRKVLIYSICVSISNPLTSAHPSVIESRPLSIDNVVVFPAPLCPSKTKI